MSLKPFSERFPAEHVEVDESMPERNLLAAMLERCCRDLLNSLEEGDRRIQREACAWLMSTNTDVMSFKWVCHYLDLKPKEIRRWIFERKRDGKVYPQYENRGHFFNTGKVLNRTKRAEQLNEGLIQPPPESSDAS